MKPKSTPNPAPSPVDELFARRLGQHRIKPDPAGWSRLQERLAGGAVGPRVVVFWQNPVVLRSAAAACVILLLLAGGWWHFRPMNTALVAQNQPVKRNLDAGKLPKTLPPIVNQSTRTGPAVASRNGLSGQELTEKSGITPALIDRKLARESGLATAKPASQFAQNSPESTQNNLTKTNPTAQIAPTDKLTAEPTSGRVLVVTIAEPDALIEARQAANWAASPTKTITIARVKTTLADSTQLAEQRRMDAGKRFDLAQNDEQTLVDRAYKLIRTKITKKSPKP